MNSNLKRINSSLSGDDDLDNQKCPRCNNTFDFTTEIGRNGDGLKNYLYRRFERHKHICIFKKN